MHTNITWIEKRDLVQISPPETPFINPLQRPPLKTLPDQKKSIRNEIPKIYLYIIFTGPINTYGFTRIASGKIYPIPLEKMPKWIMDLYQSNRPGVLDRRNARQDNLTKILEGTNQLSSGCTSKMSSAEILHWNPPLKSSAEILRWNPQDTSFRD